MTKHEFSGHLSRRHVLGGLGGLGLAAVAGAAPRFAMAAEGGATTLRAAITGYSVINSLDPAKASLIPEFYVIWGLYNGLVTFDDQMKIVPELAESYSALPEGGYEFKLREGVKFHNGDEMTAEDVKFSFDRVMAKETASPNASKLAKVREVEVVDPLTVRVHTDGVYAPLLTFLTNSRTGTQIVPKKVVEAMGDEAFGKAPVGTGAFKLTGWKAGEGLTLAAHEAYFGGKGAFDTVEMPLISEEASGVTALKGGQIDMTATAPASAIAGLMKSKEVTVDRQPGLNTRFISVNLKKAPFDDVHFRRAVSMAFQREAVVNAVLFGEGVPAQGVIPPQMKEYYSDNKRPYMSFDPKAAKSEMAKSKYKPDEIEVPVLTWGGGWWKRFAEIFVAQVNQVLGTNFKVSVTDANAAYARQQSGDFIAGVWGWLGMVDPDEYVGGLLTTGGWRNFGGYSNPEVDKLAAQGLTETDPAKRGPIYQKAEDLAMADMAVIPCFCSNIANLLRPDLKGFVQKPYSNYADQFHSMKFA